MDYIWWSSLERPPKKKRDGVYPRGLGTLEVGEELRSLGREKFGFG